MSKYTPIDDALHAYLLAHRTPDDALLVELQEETKRVTGQRAGMQIAPEEGTLLALLVASTGSRRVVEVGTFTGYSALCMARALPPGGTLLACDVSEEYTAVARRFWQKAGMADRIKLVLAPAVDTLRALPVEELFDFGFIDADKTNYAIYYEEILKRLRPGGLIAVDNVLWSGAVVRETEPTEDTRAIRALNDQLAADRRVQTVMIGVSDGITLARKLG
jgi:caffeoyl-CoA O-methyltransferase